MRITTILFFVLSFVFGLHSQNLLNTNTWKVGKGSVRGFAQNGSTSENSRVYGKNHIGDKVVLWKATPDKAVNADGGWNSSYHKINHRKAYRFSVWMKKTNSHSGNSYLGCGGNILNLSGSRNTNPYFWYGDLPKLNRWYLIVGFVHGSSYKSRRSSGAIYDGVTGKKIKTITDFKFKVGATITRHRSYLYYDGNILDNQYFWAPRLEQVNGREPSITSLLKIRKNSKLLVSYDTSNNQTRRFYCPDSKYCSLPAARKAKHEKESTSEDYKQVKDSLKEIDVVEKAMIFNNKANSLYSSEENKYGVKVFPNPTSDFITVDISKIKDIIHSIKLYSSNSSLLQNVKFKELELLEIDLTNKSVGVYFLHIHLTKGKSITKQIIKK